MTPLKQRPFYESSKSDTGCLVLIGMPGSGKSTLGSMLAGKLDWLHVDTDQVLEAWWGLPLQDIKDRLGLDRFLTAEERAVIGLWLSRCVVSTGGSVVYSEDAMAKLKSMGAVVFLEASLQTIAERIGTYEQRGLAIRPGQDLADLFQERMPLYRRYADFTLRTDQCSPVDCIQHLYTWFTTNAQTYQKSDIS